jgi:hypothetical protein
LQLFDKSTSFPETVSDLKNVENMVLKNGHLRVIDFNDFTIPTSRYNVKMVSSGGDMRCVTYDLKHVVQDLLNDGDHGQYAIFKFTPETSDVNGQRIFSELWTANWWERQQLELGPEANILVPLFYMDETPVSYNGRNMHPIYFSLGNLHVSFRWQILKKCNPNYLCILGKNYLAKDCLVFCQSFQ